MKRALTEQEFGRIGVDVGSVSLDAVLLISGAFDYESLLSESVQREIRDSSSIAPNIVDKDKICEPACNSNTGECKGSKWSNLVYIKGVNVRLGQYLSEGIRDLRQTLLTCDKVVLRLPRTSVPFTCSCDGTDCSDESFFSNRGITLKVLDRKFYDGYANLKVEGSMSAALLPEVEISFTISEPGDVAGIYTYDCTAATGSTKALQYREKFLKNTLVDVPGEPEDWSGLDIDFYPNSKENHFISNWNPIINNATSSVKSTSTQVLDLNKLNGVPYGTTWNEYGSASIAYGEKSKTSSKYDIYIDSLLNGNLPLAEIPDSFYSQRANRSGRFDGSKRGFTDTIYIGHKETYTSASICFASGTLKTVGNQVRRGLEPSLYSARYFTGSAFPMDTVGNGSFRITSSIQNPEMLSSIVRVVSSSVSTGSAAEPEVLYYYAAPELYAFYRNVMVDSGSNVNFYVTGSFPYLSGSLDSVSSSKGLFVDSVKSRLTLYLRKLAFRKSTPERYVVTGSIKAKNVFIEGLYYTFYDEDISFKDFMSRPSGSSQSWEFVSASNEIVVHGYVSRSLTSLCCGEYLDKSASVVIVPDQGTTQKLTTLLVDSGLTLVSGSVSCSLNYNRLVFPKNKTVPDKNDIIYRYVGSDFHRLPDSVVYLPDTDRILITDTFGKVVDVVVSISGSTMSVEGN